MWLPVLYIKSHPLQFPDAPADGTSYQFSFYCGVLCTSVCIFVAYSLIKRNKPWINPESAVPAALGGITFSIGMSLFIVAIDNLDQAIAYPICTMLPGLVVSSWGIFYFREITGRRNIMKLAVAYGLTLIGVALVTVSKEIALF
ncbi:hypothetical protein OESDEN_15400 [Oesophagostomum dentatum]|uniref:EamA domain-containing protein n=1 Tax=Oesophagostomum dentatum TaxID=61180 RepID=A0A0B1SNU1_OESDE|nr:hypothetical protein OESDEN_15400 [Oesophagostomum dentatum]